jgi:hypothetical protein
MVLNLLAFEVLDYLTHNINYKLQWNFFDAKHMVKINDAYPSWFLLVVQVCLSYTLVKCLANGYKLFFTTYFKVYENFKGPIIIWMR